MANPAPIYTVTKDPESRLDYGFDWSGRGWLDDVTGDTISVATWAVSPTGDANDLTKVEQAAADGITSAVFTKGIDGTDYLVTCQITLTPSGRKDERTMRIRVRNR
jgi:hypothetical protein